MISRLRALLGHSALHGAALVALAGGLIVAVPHPAAPWALSWADASWGGGSPHAAVDQYVRIATVHPRGPVREQARRRAALVLATQLGQPAEARRQLEALLPTLRGEARGELLVQIGELLVDEGTFEGAAARFEQAAKATDHPVTAGRRLLTAARILAANQRERAAELLYQRVIRDAPPLVGEAELGRAELKLRKGKTEQALAAFDRAARHTYDPDVISVARLGRALCLERLGDLDSALAELEQVEAVPEPIRDQRAGQIRSRRGRPEEVPAIP